MEKLFKIFEKANQELYLVGGWVRDYLMGIESSDIDFATSATPQQIQSILKSNGLKVIPIGIEYGTIQTQIDGIKVEITTYRSSETYTKGSRKPTVKFGTTINEDLLRRDFTFNAIAMDKNLNPIDPYNGIQDLRNGIIRTPQDPSISFSDDPLRMLRACRFEARRIGKVDDATFFAIRANRYLTSNLSSERIFDEFNKILMSLSPSSGLAVFAESMLLEAVFPELWDTYVNNVGWDNTLKTVKYTPKVSEIRWAALFGGSKRKADVWNNEIAPRLKTSNDFRNHVYQLIFEYQNLNIICDVDIRRLIYRLGDKLQNLLQLVIADKKARHPEELKEISKLYDRIDKIQQHSPVSDKFPKGTGDIVSNYLGIKGLELGRVMEELKQKAIDGEISINCDVKQVLKEMYNVR